MDIKSYMRTTRARIVAVLVSAALALTGLVVWNPFGLYAQAADEDRECIIGTSTIKECFSQDIVREVVVALKDIDNRISENSILTNDFADGPIPIELNLNNKSSLKNIDKLTGMTELSLKGFRPSSKEDYKILQRLTKLESLNLDGAQLFDDLNLLNGLTDLRELDISRTEVRDLSPLPHQHPNLEKLSAADNSLYEPQYDAWKADVGNTGVSQSRIKDINDLGLLQELDLSGNYIQDPSLLSPMVNLKKVVLDRNKITDITSLADLITNKLTSFSADRQEAVLRDAVLGPGEAYSLNTAIVDSNNGIFAPLSRAKDPYGNPPSEQNSASAKWSSPKVGELGYGLNFSAKVGNNFKFAGTINQKVKAKVVFLDENGTEITQDGKGSFAAQITSGKTPSEVTFPEVSMIGHDPVWTKQDANGEEEVSPETIFKSAAVVKLSWKKKKYTASFNTSGTGQDVQAPDNQTIEYEGKVEEKVPEAPHGWKFKHWSLDGSTDPYNFENTLVTGDVKLNAQWERLRYQVKYEHADTGGQASDPQTVEFERNATEPNPPTRKGYTFKGWTADKKGDVPFNFGAAQITDNTVVYAQWEINKYDVNFVTGDPNNPSAPKVTHTDKQQKVEYRNKAQDTSKEFSKPGYVVDYWTTDEAGRNRYDFNKPVTDNTTLYAKWRKIKVNFDEQNKTPVFTNDVNADGLPGKPNNDPKRKGYNFSGWSLTPDGSQPYDFKTPLEDGVTLFAIWDPIENPVVFEVQGGSAVDSQQVKYENTANKPVNPTREGYKFIGWTSDPEGKKPFDFSSKIVSSTKVYAQWEKVEENKPGKEGDKGTSTHGKPSEPGDSQHGNKDGVRDPNHPNNDKPQQPDHAAEPSSPQSRSILARTGSAVVGVIGIAFILLLASSAFIAFARKRTRK